MHDIFETVKTIILLSIRPHYVTRLLDGRKSVELRRSRPKVEEGDIVLIYESSPTRALIGYAVIEKIKVGEPSELWRQVGTEAGISRQEYDRYFDGASLGFGIGISDITRLTSPVSLTRLREMWKGFHPPQSYRYVPAGMAKLICASD